MENRELCNLILQNYNATVIRLLPYLFKAILNNNFLQYLFLKIGSLFNTIGLILK